ncbi:MAG: tetratricopeptide repeat protein [Candidatus Melainabacteria bacterium]|nr:tetratricopeptide repeat protein [Candidatus Melainabacteria bacterium]
MRHRNWLSALIATSMIAPAFAQDASVPTPSAVPGIEFTKIQDLNPNARGTNRLVRQKWAVVIGASKFREGRLAPGGAEAADMAQSAKEFSEYLVDPNGGRFDRNHVKVLLDANASRQNIMTALGPSFLGNGVGPDDLVVVYIATSAFPTTDGNTYLCAYDCALDNIYGTCISMQTLMTQLKENVKSDRIVLILQSAYSGAAGLDSGSKSLGPQSYNLDLSKVVMGNGFIIMSSSQPNEITWSSAFSKNLTSALRQEGGLISLDKAFAIAKDKTASETATAGFKKKQIPAMKSTWSGTSLVLGAPPAERVANLPASVNSFLSAEGSYLKASNLIAEGKTDDALEQYKLAIAADPKYADALADYGAALTMKDDWKSASEMYKKAIAARPTDELFHINHARILDKIGDKAGSLEELNTAYRLNPKDVSVLKTLSTKSLAAGKTDEAVRYIEEAVDLYPGNSELRERLSITLLKSGDIDQALAQAKEAVKLNQKSATAHTTLGSVLLVRGFVGPAVESYKEAVKFAPKDANGRWLLSRAMEQNGDRAGAIAELHQFLNNCPAEDPRAAKAKEHLKELENREQPSTPSSN